MKNITLPSLLEMLKNGVHFGHQKSRWHPKMKPFIFSQRNDVHIIDLEKTQDFLKKSLQFVYDQAAQGGEILFVGTKKQIKNIIFEAAQKSQSPWVNEKWVGGTFTNFSTIVKLIRKMEKLEKQKEKGDWNKYTKKEQLDLEKSLKNLTDKVGGIRKMTKLPAAVFIVDIKEEKTALMEARKKNIPLVAVCDTNSDPSKVDYPIPANDDAVKSVTLICDLVASAILEGKKEFSQKGPTNTEQKKQVDKK